MMGLLWSFIIATVAVIFGVRSLVVYGDMDNFVYGVILATVIFIVEFYYWDQGGVREAPAPEGLEPPIPEPEEVKP